MKMMVVVLAVFFSFSWVSGQFDPTALDDFHVNLTGTGGAYNGSFVRENATPGFWYVTVKAYQNNNEVAMNETVFFVGPKTEQITWIHATGAQMGVSTDKGEYSAGETVRIYANHSGATGATAKVNSGTRFYVDLPVTIPLINLRRIYDSQSWFIFLAVIIGLLANPLLSLKDKIIAPKSQDSEKR